MAGNHSVMEDSSTLSKIDRHLYKVEQIFALISGIAVFSLIMFAVVSVTGRASFTAPLPGYVDIIEQVMSLIAFMGVSYCQRDGIHIRMDMFVGQLHGRVLWAVELITVSLITILIALLIWGSWAHFLRSFDFGQPLWSTDSSIDIGIPIWPTKILVPIAFSVLLCRLILQIWGFARAFIENAERPVAVPLVLDIVTQATIEIDQLSEFETKNKNNKKKGTKT